VDEDIINHPAVSPIRWSLWASNEVCTQVQDRTHKLCTNKRSGV